MRKTLLKKLESMTLISLMAFGILAGIPAKTAKAGEGEKVSISIYDPSSYDEEKGDFKVSYPVTGEGVPAGLSYDEKSQTLTLTDFKQEKCIINMGISEGDFTLNVKGDNKLGMISIMVEGYWGVADPKNVKINITGDGTLTLDPNKIVLEESNPYSYHLNFQPTIGVNAHTNTVALNIGKYVNLNVYGSKKESSSGKIPVVSNSSTTVAAFADGINIEGDVSETLNFKISKQYQGVTPYLAYGNNMKGFLVQKDEVIYIAEYGKEYTSDTSPSVYYVKSIDQATTGHCYTSDSCIAKFSSYEELAKKYTVLQTTPEQYKGKSYITESDGKVYVDAFERKYWSSFDGLCTKNNVKYAFDYNYDYNDDNGDGEISEDERKYYYSLYNISNLGSGFFDSEADYYCVMSKEQYDGIRNNPVKISDTGEVDNHLASGKDTYFEDLQGNGYDTAIKSTYYTHIINNDPLIIKAKAKPAANIKVLADAFTKNVGDAAFDLGATTDAGAKLTYASSDAKVVTVSDAGLVTVVGAGTADITITASGDDFQTATKVVKVTVSAVKVGSTEKDTKTGATYKVTESKDGKVEVEYKPAAASKGKVTIPSTVTVNGQSATVTSIADNSFAGNKKITAVTLPATVEEIGDGAFKNCTKLKNMTLPANVEEVGANAFAGCTSLTKVTFKGKKVTKVDKGAFKNCPKLKSMNLPDSITEIGANAFAGDKKLTNIKVTGNNIKKVGKKAFDGLSKKAVIRVPKKMKKKYEKLFKKAGFKGKVK